MKKETILTIGTGIAVGLSALLLSAAGNPANMGFCIACFLRDIAGACGLHSAAAVQAVRPEIIGIVLGAFFMALAWKEFQPKGGSSPFTRFVIAAFVMVGALMFLGCPLRMLLRIGGGDWNALVGLGGFVAGIGVGAVALHKGFSLKRAYAQNAAEGGLLPAVLVALLALALFVPAVFTWSVEGPGTLRAPLLLSLVCGGVVGALAQRSRLCMAGGIRNAVLLRDFKLLWGILAIVATVLLGNLVLGNFKPGFQNQPVAHTDGLWNFMGMLLVGWGSVLLGGCPLRQLILAGEGNSDSAMTVMGLIAGAAFCHTFSLASSGAGPTENGMIATAIGLVVLGMLSILNLQKAEG